MWIPVIPVYWGMNTQNKKFLVEVGQMGIKNESWLVNLFVTLGY